MVIKDMRDIERERDERERAELKERVVDDVNDVFSNLVKKRKEQKKERKKKRKWWVKLLIALLSLGIFLFAINFLLGNVWLLKFFVKELFSIGG